MSSTDFFNAYSTTKNRLTETFKLHINALYTISIMISHIIGLFEGWEMCCFLSDPVNTIWKNK